MYFPPFPALLRIPVLLTTHHFDGRLTLLSMALAWVVLRRRGRPSSLWLRARPDDRGTEVSPARRVARRPSSSPAATGGTFLTFDASLPWVYHEVYAVGGRRRDRCALLDAARRCARPTRRAARAGCSVRARSPSAPAPPRAGRSASACSRSAPGCARSARAPPSTGAVVAGRCSAGVVAARRSRSRSTSTSSTRLPVPPQDQVWTEINPHRREALAANGGTLTGPQFFPTSFMAYFRPDGIRFVDYFPWITLPAHPAPAYDGAVRRPDLPHRQRHAFMPLFCSLPSSRPCSLPAAAPSRAPVLRAPARGRRARHRRRDGLRLLRHPLHLRVRPGAGARWRRRHRPARAVLRRPPRWLSPCRSSAAVALAAFSIAAQMATGATPAATTARGDAARALPLLQQRLTRRRRPARHPVDDLPDRRAAPTTWPIRGDCDALYLNTGDDATSPGCRSSERDRGRRASSATARSARTVPLLARRHEAADAGVDLETDGDGQVRFVLITTAATPSGRLVRPARPTGVVRIGVRDLTDWAATEIDSSPGRRRRAASRYLERTATTAPDARSIADRPRRRWPRSGWT